LKTKNPLFLHAGLQKILCSGNLKTTELICPVLFLIQWKEMFRLRTTAMKVRPEDYILSVLSAEDRLDAAFRVAREAFKRTKLTMKDIDKAIDWVRRRAYEKRTAGICL
jgi:hypothetical protein